MKIETLGRHFREGSRSVLRNGWMSFASISAITISLFILGLFLMLTMNVNYLASQIESQVEIRVYMDIETKPEQVKSVEEQIAKMPDVSKVTFVSKEQGLQILREKLGEDSEELLEGFEGAENPLNDSFNVEVREPRLVQQAAQQIEALNILSSVSPPPIYKVSYGQGTVETLFKVTNAVRNVGLVFVLLLGFTALFLISNTIKMTIVARRREIGIMKLVGATNAFIRWPFFIEGAMLGLIGSAVPAGLLAYGYWQFVKFSKLELGLMLIKLLPAGQVMSDITWLLLGIGVFIGVWGSLMSMRKFMSV
ncbi:permease-like cell division protein FtsX [Paenibacillus koleovorans]|uniref:permease-like cell division protein FtsX n=1 Tax=Paenibacillus koleovorans TaxID=121608 RepID=UPI000FD78B0C|nr:permease-like cell division protein FtsX [Paenibacillus koleovorans]